MASKSKGFYIFCDESKKNDKFYSNFYGGTIIEKSNFSYVNDKLSQKVKELEFEDSELKWSNINDFRVRKYIEVLTVFFDLMKEELVKVRIMFTDNRHMPVDLKEGHRKVEYHLLYYQFLKHAFGFKYLYSDIPIDLEIFFDVLPDNKRKNAEFKKFIFGLQFLPEFSDSNLRIKREWIQEVDSKKHLILQCTDVILGAMAFRLNDGHKVKPLNSYKRGKRTIAKEKVYKFISKRIREIRPNFNIGITTGRDNDNLNIFTQPYRHWLFIPKNSVYKKGGKNKKRPNSL